MIAGSAMVLTPAPAHAEFISWMSDGVRYCYDDGRVPGAPDPVPVEELPAAPDPSPVPAPVPVQQAPLEPPLEQAPAPVPVQPAPAPVPAQPVPAHANPVPVYVPPRPGENQAVGNLPAGQPGVDAAIETAPVEAPPAAETAAPVAGTADAPTVSGSPAAAVSPPSSLVSVPDSEATQQASSSGLLNPLPLFLTAGGAVLAAAGVRLVRPVRAALARRTNGK
jgi:hypothetical protein